MRIALVIEYDGSRYHGWQKQDGLPTIQQQLEKALTKIANHEINVTCAGRTDQGVHATNQIIHFDCNNHRPMSAWLNGTNSYLPKDICIKRALEVPKTFHARYSALGRGYRYIIFNSPTRPVLLFNRTAWQFRDLNIPKMQEASKQLIGTHDFSSFRAKECQSQSSKRDLYSIDIKNKGKLVIIDICANAFLHHMVRNIVGVLMLVGTEKKKTSWVKEVLEAKDRSKAAATAPPQGLYLAAVYYPTSYFFASIHEAK